MEESVNQVQAVCGVQAGQQVKFRINVTHPSDKDTC